MKTIDLSLRKFAILSAIMARPRTSSEVMTLLNWTTGQPSFRTVTLAMRRDGLIEARPVLARRAPSFQLEITEAGRQWWKESADLYLHLIGLAQSPPDDADARETRPPTDEEFQALKAVANPSTARMLDVLRTAPFSRSVMFRLQVEDVDLARCRLRIGGESVEISPACRELLAAAIAGRTTGPALLTLRGRLWTAGNFKRQWDWLRKQAGIPSNVVARWATALAPASDRDSKHSRRLPTTEEFHALRAAARAHERHTWDVIRATSLPLEALFALDVEDVDIEHACLTIRRPGRRPQRVPINATLKRTLMASIGDRRSGPALRNARGRRWLPLHWAKAWGTLRRRAGVPKGVLVRAPISRKGFQPDRRPSTAAALTPDSPIREDELRRKHAG